MPKMYRGPRGPVWMNRPRSQRKRALLSLRHRIAKEAPFLGGLFSTIDVLGAGVSWADISFLSQIRERGFYNVTIQTALYEFFELCENRAIERSYQIYDNLLERPLFNRRPEQIEREKAAFGGLTRHQWIDQEAARIAAEDDSVSVRAGAHLDFGYRHGVGLIATIDAPFIGIDEVERFIRDFRARGEIAFRDGPPLRFDPSLSSQAHACNALADPSEWAGPTPAQQAARERELLDQVDIAPIDGASRSSRL